MQSPNIKVTTVLVTAERPNNYGSKRRTIKIRPNLLQVWMLFTRSSMSRMKKLLQIVLT